MTTMKYHFILTKMVLINKQTNKWKIKSIGAEVEILELSYISGGNLKWCSFCGKQFGSFSKG